MATAYLWNPPDLTAVAADLLPLVRDAASTLAKHPDVPAEVPAVIEKLFESLPSPDQWSGTDGYLAAALNHGLTRCFRALERDDVQRRAELRIGLEQIHQALSYLLDEAPAGEDRTPTELVRWLFDVTGATSTDLAELLDVSPSTVRRWANGAKPSAQDERRLRVIAGVVVNLRHSLTPAGVLLWLISPHRDLDGAAPADHLDDPSAYQLLRRLASRTRSSTSS
jgi:transcriptional regulator with XRE-family HTH domain